MMDYLLGQYDMSARMRRTSGENRASRVRSEDLTNGLLMIKIQLYENRKAK